MRYPPSVSIDSDDPVMLKHAYSVSQAFFSIHLIVGEFANALSLFDELTEMLLHPGSATGHDEMLRIAGWRRIPARDGAMTLFHIHDLFKGVAYSTSQCPPLQVVADRKMASLAGKYFRSAFPDFELLRHSVAHAGEATSTEDKMAGNRYSTVDSANLFVQGNLDDRRFSNSIKGKLVSYELSQASLDAVISSVTLLFDAYRRPPVHSAD